MEERNLLLVGWDVLEYATTAGRSMTSFWTRMVLDSTAGRSVTDATGPIVAHIRSHHGTLPEKSGDDLSRRSWTGKRDANQKCEEKPILRGWGCAETTHGDDGSVLGTGGSWLGHDTNN